MRSLFDNCSLQVVIHICIIGLYLHETCSEKKSFSDKRIYFDRPITFTDYFLSPILKHSANVYKRQRKRLSLFYKSLLLFTLTQSKLEVKKESGESSPSEAACLCSPPPAKNQCASCGMEIHDRYLLKVTKTDA